MGRLSDILFLILCAGLTSAAEAKDQVLPGQAAPPLVLAKLLQAPPGAVASWEELRGKVVVLEFWDAECGPCIGAIPHLNDLADEFKDKPVQIIAITDDDEKTATDFLSRRTIRAWVGLDSGRVLFSEFGIGGIPTT